MSRLLSAPTRTTGAMTSCGSVLCASPNMCPVSCSAIECMAAASSGRPSAQPRRECRCRRRASRRDHRPSTRCCPYAAPVAVSQCTLTSASPGSVTNRNCTGIPVAAHSIERRPDCGNEGCILRRRRLDPDADRRLCAIRPAVEDGITIRQDSIDVRPGRRSENLIEVRQRRALADLCREQGTRPVRRAPVRRSSRW